MTFTLNRMTWRIKTSLDDTENVIVLQVVAVPFQGLKPVDPGVPSAESPLRTYATKYFPC